MQHRRVESRPHDGRIGGALAAALHEFILHKSIDIVLVQSWLDHPQRGELRRDRSVGCVPDQIDLTGILD